MSATAPALLNVGFRSTSGELAGALVLAIVYFSAFLGLGGFLLLKAGFVGARQQPLRSAPIAAALGFGLVSYAGYLLLMVPKPGPILILAFLLASIVLGRKYLWSVVACAGGALRSMPRLTPLAAAFGLPVLLLLGLMICNWVTPVYHVDALSGYMFTARWLHDHGFTICPYNLRYSLMPFGAEIVFATSFAFATDLIAKLLDGLLGVLFVLAVFELARRYADGLSSFLAALSLAVYTPFVTLWGMAKVDNIASFTGFAAVSLLIWEPGGPAGAILLSAFLMGAACAQKYTIWLFVPGFLAGVVLVKLRSGDRRAAARWALAAAAIIVLCLVPHFVKAIAWTHNPVPPFAQTVFPTQNVYLTHHSDKGVFPLWKWAVLPWSLFFDGSYHRVRLPGPFPVLLLAGIPAVLLMPAKYRRTGTLLAIALAQLGVWIAVRREEWLVDRFLMLPLCLLLVACTPGVEWLCRHTRLARALLCAGMLALVIYDGVYLNRHLRTAVPILLGRQTREQWLEKNIPWDPFTDLRKLVRNIGPDRRVLLPGRFYFIPDGALPYISTEREVYELESLRDEMKVPYLKTHRFAYFVNLDSSQPPWTAALERLSAGENYSIFRLR